MRSETFYDVREFFNKHGKATLIVVGAGAVAIILILLALGLADVRLNQDMLRENLKAQVASDITTYMTEKQYASGTGDENGLISGYITSEEADDLAKQVADLLEKRITNSVLSGTSDLVLAELEDDIYALISEKFASLNAEERDKLYNEVMQLVLGDVTKTLNDSQASLTETKNLYTQLQLALNSLETRNATLETNLNNVQNSLNSYNTTLKDLQNGYEDAIKKATDSLSAEDAKLQAAIDALSKGSGLSESELKGTIAALEKSDSALAKDIIAKYNELLSMINNEGSDVDTQIAELSALLAKYYETLSAEKANTKDLPKYTFSGTGRDTSVTVTVPTTTD